MTLTYADFGIEIPAGQSGPEVRAVCPKCSPTRKREHQRERDLCINLDKGTWYCQHPTCEWKGSLTPSREHKVYAPPKPIDPVPDSDMEQIYEWFQRERGISPHVVHRNRITATRGSGNQLGIAFPYYRNEQHVHTTYRPLARKAFYQSTGTERIFYGLANLEPDATTLIIVEGQIDALSFNEAGIWNCVSVPDGATTSDSDTKMSFLISAMDLINRMERVYLALDNDEPGKAMTETLARRIGREKCWLVQWPDGIKDANDALTQIGPAQLHDALSHAAPYPVEGLWYSDRLEADVFHAYEHGYDPGTKTGYDELDKWYRPRKGLVSVVTGWSSHGKSTWLDHIIVRMAEQQGWKTAIFSPENQPIAEHLSRLIEIHVGKPFDKNVGGRMTPAELMDALPFANDHFCFIMPGEPTIENILDKARIALFQMDIDALIIDPWNEIEHHRPPGKTETEYISEVMTKIRSFARINDIHVWMLAHPTKPNRDMTTEQPPELWQISGSNNWWNKCDYGISIWRVPGDNKTNSQCHIKKVRFRETGKVGVVDFRVNYGTRKMEVSEHHAKESQSA